MGVRRWFRKLSQFYKIQNELTPSYLKETIPQPGTSLYDQNVLIWPKCPYIVKMFLHVKNVLIWSKCSYMVKMFLYGQKCSYMVKMFLFVQNVLIWPKCSDMVKMYCMKFLVGLQVFTLIRFDRGTHWI